jgi:hypothetical protein
MSDALAIVNGTIVGTTNSGNTLAWISSNSFAITIILGALCIIMLPFALAGLKRIFGWIDLTFIKPKKGYVKVRQSLPNGNERSFWVVPTGKFIHYKTYDGKAIEIPWNNGKEWLRFEGQLPVIQIDENNQQIPFSGKVEKTAFAQEDITMGYKASYEAGKLMGSLDMFSDLKLWLIILLVAVILTGVGNLVFNLQNSSALKALTKATPSANAIADAVYNITQLHTVNGTVPLIR